MYLPVLGCFLCKQNLSWSQIKADFIHSLSASRTLTVLQICSAANGLLMMLTFWISYSHVALWERRVKTGSHTHIHMLLVHAHTLALPPPVTVMTLTFLFVMMCVGYVYLWGADRFLLIGSPLPPPHHTRTHTDTLQIRAWGGLLFIKETLSTLLPSTDTAITTQYTC